MGKTKRLSTVLCAATNKKHVYIAVYESDSASSIVLYLLRSNASPRSLQQLTWETVTWRSMYYTHLIGRKRRPLLNACAVDDSGTFVLLSHDTAPKATSVRAPSAVYNNAEWDEMPRGLVYDPYRSNTWENVDVSPDYGCKTRLGCQTLIYARPPLSGSGTNQATFVAAQYSSNTSDPSASPFINFSVFDKSTRSFVHQTPDIEINLGAESDKGDIFTFDGKQISKTTSFDMNPSTPLLPFEYIVPVPASDDNGVPSPQWLIGFSGSQSYGIWTNGPRAGQWHKSKPSSIFIIEPSEPIHKGLVALMSLGHLILIIGCALYCHRRRQRLKKMHSDSVYEFDRKQIYP
ncbi:hypothetical protein DFQ27_006180 [Actinomortierella ambigua]|uniref:Uncharacterized protein n=1 Tax=Actinomortierella ambigua TaxID=1343610 RepID=A0A9P6U1W3_9FUNG|nr:hypothetical protein DFQ27_006180 [Actinomortierella ambigua]